MTLLSMLAQRAERPVPARRFAAADPWLPDAARHTYTRVAAESERVVLPYACPSCGAAEWAMCLAVTGLAASAPCTGRLRSVRGR